MLMYTLLLTLLETFETLLMINPYVLKFAVTHTPPVVFTMLGRFKAAVYVRAIGPKVPAYAKFLKENGVELETVKSVKDFSRLPLTTKSNYIQIFPLLSRLLDGQLPFSGNIDESAGSTGKATMWIRSFKEEVKLNRLITFALEYTFNAFHKRNVVVLNCWSNGPWATGIKFAFIAQHSTLVKAIGTSKENVIDTIKTLGKDNEYIICGYPPFTKEIIDYGEEQGLNWSDYRVNLVTGGEGFSEGWRDFMREKIKGSQGEVYSAYGASDIDIGVAFETDLTITLRKKLTNDPALRQQVLGDDRVPLFIGQYNPLIYYIERNEKGELIYTLISQHTVSPKIRYNLQDSGQLLTFHQAAALLTEQEKKKYLTRAMKLPLVIVYGRSDGTVSLDGANIYPADVQHGLFSSPLASFVNSYYLDTTYDQNQAMRFTVHIELTSQKKSNTISAQTLEATEKHLAAHLTSVNRDYRESYENNPASLSPKLMLHENGDELFAENRRKIKHVYFNKSKQKTS